MRLFVPCSIVDGRRLIMAAPSVEPVMHVFSFRSATQALDARAAVTTRPWTLTHEGVSVDVQPLEAPGHGVVWETSPEELAMSGVCGPSGFGIGMCEFLEPNIVRVIEGIVVMFEDLDYDSVRARMAADFKI
jgi:hypothetical protein